MDTADKPSGLGFGLEIGPGTLGGALAWAGAQTADADWGLLSSYAGLLGLAVLSIYAGAHSSLPVRVPLLGVCRIPLMQGVEAEAGKGRGERRGQRGRREGRGG
jgi:hypothetical protein